MGKPQAFDCGANLLSDCARSRLRAVRQDESKFLSAYTRRKSLGRFDDPGGHLANGAEAGISADMADTVVVFFEPIRIEDHQGQRAAVRVRVFPCRLQLHIERSPVGKTREFIGMRQPAES